MAVQNDNKSLVYVGSYVESKEKSISLFELDNASGEIHLVESFDGGPNPTFMTFNQSYSRLYAVNEIENYKGLTSGAVSAFSVQSTSGFLTLLNRVSSIDQLPAHLTLDRDEKILLIANYKDGSVTVIPVENDGSIANASALIEHKGSGLHPKRQSTPHAHCILISPDGNFVFVVDLGLDQVLSYRLENKDGRPKLTAQKIAFHSQPGTGPRQMCFHPNKKFAYLIHELESIIVALSYNDKEGAFLEIQTISTLPKNFTKENKCGAILVSMDGRHLYCSNRGHDSIALFEIDADSGTLTYVENVSCEGKWPREFTINMTGNLLLVANKNSDNVVTFKIDRNTGKLTFTGAEVKVEMPAVVQVVPKFKRMDNM